MIAIVLADLGTPLHSNGGETLIPSQVYWLGIGSPSLKAELVNFISVLPVCCGEGAGGAGD
jgi:hypothetical protein